MLSPTRIILLLHFCTIIFLGIYMWWVLSEIFLVVRSVKTWVQEMVYHPILRWVLPSWDYMMHPEHSPIFFVLLFRKGVCYHIFLALYYLILLHPLWDFSVWRIHCFLNSDIFYTIIACDYDQGLLKQNYPLLFHLHHPHVYHDI